MTPLCLRVFAALPILSLVLLAQADVAGLRQYLGLTAAQADAINKANRDFNSFAGQQQGQLSQLQSDIANLSAQDSLDPAALGDRYLQIELIQRSIRAKQADTRKQIAAVLTSSQMQALQKLDAAFRLQPPINEATCAKLIANPPAFRWFNTTGFAAGSFGTIGGVLDILPSTAGVQIGCSSAGTYLLQQYFSLTDSQVAGISANTGAQTAYSSSKQDRIGEVQYEIAVEIAKDQPDAMALGVRYAEIIAIQRDLSDGARTLVQTNRALLNDAQRALLKSLEDASALLALAGDAQCNNLIEAPIASGQQFGFCGGPL